MPSELEIIGSPSLKFAANMNFGDYFSKMIDKIVSSDEDDEINTLPCTNPTLRNKVFLLQMEIYRNDTYEFEKDENGNVSIGDDLVFPPSSENSKITLPFKVPIASSSDSDSNFTTSFKGLDDYLKGFEFNGVHAKAYIHGNKLVKALNIDIYINDDETPIELDGKNSKESSSVDISQKEYLGFELPPGGTDIDDVVDIINKGEDLSFRYEIYIVEGTPIDSDWLYDTHKIVVEILIWLPLAFDSKEDDASFDFSDFFDELGGVIKSLAETGNIESMQIKIAIDPSNPFGHGIFVISDEGYGDIKNPLDEHHFNINFTKEDLEYINKNTYDPSFFILFPNIHSLLEIPNGDIMITTISLDAKLRYNMEL